MFLKLSYELNIDIEIVLSQIVMILNLLRPYYFSALFDNYLQILIPYTAE